MDNRPNLPCGDLIGKRIDYIRVCVPLYDASIRGDWEAAKAILDQRPELVQFAISENYDTALHIAASAKRTKLLEKFVTNLVNRMTNKELELQNKYYNTALCVAVAAENVEIARTMVYRHEALLDIAGRSEWLPLYMACLYGKGEMAKYLYGNKKMTGGHWTDEIRGRVLHNCVQADLFDIALKILADNPELAKTGSVLGVLARKTDACRKIKPHIIWRVIRCVFEIIGLKIGPANKPSDAMKLVSIIWKQILTLSNVKIDDVIKGQATMKDGMEKYPNRILFIAAKTGNTKFVVKLIRQYPDLLWQKNDKNRSIFHVAVKYRHEGIYNLLYEIGSMKDVIFPLKDMEGNDMLHLVGKCPKKKRLGDVSGVALQMQRELLWFKEVENMLPPACREKKNNKCQTPRSLFSKEHKKLLSGGEKWMKDTASQCMVISALIATVAFGAAFTVPGGYDQDNGIPMFLHKINFTVFVVADAISLILSSISILIFLSVHLATYSENDFLDSLPKTLMNGLTTLFVSVLAMMVAFSVSFFVIYQNNLAWVPTVIGAFAFLAIIVLIKLQYRVLKDVYCSTYARTNLFKPKKVRLYLQNPKF